MLRRNTLAEQQQNWNSATLRTLRAVPNSQTKRLNLSSLSHQTSGQRHTKTAMQWACCVNITGTYRQFSDGEVAVHAAYVTTVLL